MSTNSFYQTLIRVVSLAALLNLSIAQAEFAVLVATDVLVESNPAVVELPPEEDPNPSLPSPEAAINASYISSGGWAVTGRGFVDVTVAVFDFGTATSVSSARLSLPIDAVFSQDEIAELEIFFYSDNGIIEITDYSIGFILPIAEIDAAGLTQLDIDVTAAVNSTLASSQFVGFRIGSTTLPDAIEEGRFPAWVGVKFLDGFALEYTPGDPPLVANDMATFDLHTLELPNIDAPGIGTASAQFRLVDPNNFLFQLTNSVVTSTGPVAPAQSGIELFDCNAFEPPVIGGAEASAASYADISGILDIPSVDVNGEQIAIRLEFIEGSDPATFETLSFAPVQVEAPEGVVSDLDGSLIVEPSQDFVPLCHGWVLVGDSIRNRVVERNILSGETGATYTFNTIPGQFTLDDINGAVYMTAHPESERLYRLDLNTGVIGWNRVSQTLTNAMGSHTYNWALRDLALGEDGNVFAIMFDNIGVDPELELPFAGTGLWLGLMDGNANFLNDSLPLEEPIRIEYDTAMDHVFLATASNLATFNFDAGTNSLSFVEDTDQQVGSGCTDFSVSPDGTRLAYSCPNGNRVGEVDFSILDMNPIAYFDIDGEWFLGASPVSAVFNSTGTLLIATDNEKLYFFDVVSHLILEEFELGLIEGENIRKIRLSRDGNLLLLFLENEIHDPSSKFYWMSMPNITGTPL